MSIDESQLEALRQSLQADDYRMDVAEQQGRMEVRIAAGPSACEECLVPKALMLSMLAPILGIEPDKIELVYPADVPAS